VELVQAVVSDQKGILAVEALSLSRRSWRDFEKKLPRQDAVATAEVSRDHARQLIAEAEAIGARNGFSPPPRYADALRVLGPAPETPPPSPGLSVQVADERASAQAGAALFEDPLFSSWIPEEEDLRRFALRVDEVSTSQLYIDDAQRRQGFEHAAAEAAAAYFTPERRALYARRLLEMAHVLASVGRGERAQIAAAVSRALEKDADNPFCRTLFTHPLRGRYSADKRQQQPPPAAPTRLVTPP
jgi:hypothetical protein